MLSESAGVIIPCPCCSSLSIQNWNCHLLYILGQEIYDLFQGWVTEKKFWPKTKKNWILPNILVLTNILIILPFQWLAGKFPTFIVTFNSNFSRIQHRQIRKRPCLPKSKMWNSFYFWRLGSCRNSLSRMWVWFLSKM